MSTQPTAPATPRTDALRAVPMTRADSDDFARTLERELAAAQAATAEAKAEVADWGTLYKRLEAELGQQRREVIAQGDHAVAMTELAQSLQARAETAEAQAREAIAESAQLRAEVADIAENNISRDLYELSLRNNDQLRARVSELEQDKARLVELLKVAVCPDQNCDGNGSSWHVEQSSQSGEPEQVQHQCQWCDERKTAIAARDGKGAP